MPKFFGESLDISDELAETIFDYFDVKTLSRNANLVSKDWKRIIDKKIDDPICRSLLCILGKSPDFENESLKNISKVKKLSGGLTNTTIFFKANNTRFVARHPGKDSEKFIDRECEAKNLAIANKYGITAEMLFVEEKGAQIAFYLKKTHPHDI